MQVRSRISRRHQRYSSVKMCALSAPPHTSSAVKRTAETSAGLEYRGGRMALFNSYSYFDDAYPPTAQYQFVDMDDVINLHLGANYRLNSTINIWLQTHNLLNRGYDILYGMGAQRIGFMVGAGFTF